jgi:RHS protein.
MIHHGLPLTPITPDNTVAWRTEYDEWGSLSGEDNPENLEQMIRRSVFGQTISRRIDERKTWRMS